MDVLPWQTPMMADETINRNFLPFESMSKAPGIELTHSTDAQRMLAAFSDIFPPVC